MEYYSTLKKKVALPFVTACMSLEGIMLNEISQTEKDNCITPIWTLEKKKIELLATESRMVVAKGWKVEEMGRGW